MPKNSKDKLMSIVNFLRDSVSQVSSDVEDLGKSLNNFLKTLSKAQKDLKGIKVGKGEFIEEAAPEVAPEKVTPTTSSNVDVREKAAATLFSMLSSSKGPAAATDKPTASVKASSTSSKGKPSGAPTGPPSKPSGAPTGPPSKPSGAPTGPPSKPSGAPAGPPSKPSGAPAGPPAKSSAGKSTLPPPPKMPPAPGKPSAPSVPEGTVKTPSFVKGPAAPPKPSGTPMSPPPPKLPGAPGANKGATKPTAPTGGAGVTPESFGSLRDEMLKELDRLKKIMRGN